MNILYVGPYRQKDGWGEASRNFILSLQKTKHEIAIRPIFLGGAPILGDMPQPFSSLELRNLDDYDAVIQHTLPSYFEYDGRFGKNIGMFFYETGNYKHTGWVEKCNLLDEIWVSSDVEMKNAKQSGVETTIKKVHIPVDVTKFQRSYDKNILPTQGFTFYFIGEYIQRKNLNALIFAFNREFGTSEPVNLVIKTSRGGMRPEQLRQTIEADIKHLKSIFRTYPKDTDYKKEIIITDYLQEEDLMRLHSACSCFIMPSHGEAWCLPAMDALGMGKTPIITNNTGMCEFINDDNGWTVKSHSAPVFSPDPFAFPYTARETWENIDYLALQQAMREVFSNEVLRKAKAAVGIESVYNFSYEKIANQINEST